MTLHVVGYGIANAESAAKYKMDPKFRKATHNMLWALSAAEDALKMTSQVPPIDTHLVLGTSHGELEITKDFLFTLNNGGAPRPFLFQNSLHNATAGFLALRLGLQNTSVTISCGHFTGEKTIETARLLLQQPRPQIALAIGVEGHVESLWPASQLNYPAEVVLRPGAAALILANEQGLQAFGLRSYLQLEKTAFKESHGTLDGPYYDSNGLEEIIIKLIGQTKTASPLVLNKPGGLASEIYFHRSP